MTKKDALDDNMTPLENISKKLTGIKFIKRIHPALVADARTSITPNIDRDPEKLYKSFKKEIGYSPIGHWQFLYKKGKKTVSCIKGMGSAGMYEIMDISKNATSEPERYKTAAGTLVRIKEILG